MLKNLKTRIANRALCVLFYFSWRKFWKNSYRVERVQSDYILRLVRKNSITQFGKQFNFKQILNIEDFQKFVPISNYEDYSGFIDKIKDVQKLVLTTEPIKKFSLSSGTSSASKYIPNNQLLIREFDRCISVWMFDLYKQFPKLLNGKSFWIITPSTKPEESDSSVNTGFDNDSEYFSFAKQWLIRNIFVVPDEVAQYCHGDDYYYALGVFLLVDKSLVLVSVWNPSVLLILLEKIIQYRERIFSTIETGKLVFAGNIEKKSANKLELYLSANNLRAKELREIFNSNLDKIHLWQKVWPNLQVISAWDCAWAVEPAKQIKRMFPEVTFQGKGLLATEACISFPAYNSEDSYKFYPAYTSHFFEFEEVESKQIKFLHELEQNVSYEVLVTSGGGFYRYRLNDIVTCYGFSNGLPLLHFEGKSNLVSDIAGEKLNENHVNKVLLSAFEKLSIISSFYFLSPETNGVLASYSLFIQTESQFENETLITEIEKGLFENFHYKHCRQLGQLEKLKIYLLNIKQIELFYTVIQEKYQLGSFKQMALRKEIFWKDKFGL